jgi:hypothetical protein
MTDSKIDGSPNKSPQRQNRTERGLIWTLALVRGGVMKERRLSSGSARSGNANESDPELTTEKFEGYLTLLGRHVKTNLKEALAIVVKRYASSKIGLLANLLNNKISEAV